MERWQNCGTNRGRGSIIQCRDSGGERGAGVTLYQILSLIGIPSLIGAVALSIFNFIKSKSASSRLIKEGVLAILHNKIYTQGKEYIEQGHISLEDMKDFEYLYDAYHNLGGNGTGTEIYERVKNLSIR